MPSTLILGLNPAWQRLFVLPELCLGEVHRLPRALEYASGKGVNCARVLDVLGSRACVAHFLGGASGECLGAELRNAGVEQLVVDIAAQTRVCTTLAVAASVEGPGHSTELIEPSPVVTEDEVQALLETLRASWGRFNHVAVCGSFPAGFGEEALAVLPVQNKLLYIDAVRGVDRWMCQGVELLKVNEAELRNIFARLSLVWPTGINDWSAVAHILRGAWPVRHLVVTCGALGAYWVGPENDCHFLPVLPSVRFRNAIGAGDAFLAGWLHAANRGAAAQDCFCAAAATAQARCEASLPWDFLLTRRNEILEQLRSSLQEVV